MNHFDYHDEIRRLIERATSLPDPIRVYLAEEQARQAQLRAVMEPPRYVLDELNRSEAIVQSALQNANAQSAAVATAMNVESSLAQRYYDVEARFNVPLEIAAAHSAALEAAMSPFPDISRFVSDARLRSIAEAARRLSAGFASAPVIGEFDLDVDDPSVGASTEEQLVRLVPAEALADLRRVDFAPILLLDRVFRDPAILHEISDREFEAVIARLVEELGFKDVTLTRRIGDGGRDVLAKARVHGIDILFAFECKHYSPDRRVGVAIARALLGTIAHRYTRANKGVLVTTSQFTRPARHFILTEPSLDGKDFNGIIRWIHKVSTRRQRRNSR